MQNKRLKATDIRPGDVHKGRAVTDWRQSTDYASGTSIVTLTFDDGTTEDYPPDKRLSVGRTPCVGCE